MDRLPSESLNLQTKSRLAVSSHSDAVKSTQEELAVAASRIRHLTGRFGLTQRAEDKPLSLPAKAAI